MADSIREKAMQGLATIVASAAGLSAAQVTRTPAEGPSEGDFPRVDIQENDDNEAIAGDQKPNAKVSHRMSVTLRVWVTGPDNAQQRLNNLCGEIEKKIRQNVLVPGYKLGGFAINCYIPSRRSAVRRDAQFHAMFIDLLVEYRHALDDPFSL